MLEASNIHGLNVLLV